MKDKKKWGDSGMEWPLGYANSIIATLREPFLVLDQMLLVISANDAFYAAFKVAEKETIGRSLPGLGNGQWDIPKLLQLLREILTDKKVVRDFEAENVFNH